MKQMRRSMGRVIVGGAAALAMATSLTAPSAWAAEDERLSDADYAAVVAEVYATGKVTAQQRKAILSRPELAKDIVDPTSAKADYEMPGYRPDPLERPAEVNDAATATEEGASAA